MSDLNKQEKALELLESHLKDLRKFNGILALLFPFITLLITISTASGSSDNVGIFFLPFKLITLFIFHGPLAICVAGALQTIVIFLERDVYELKPHKVFEKTLPRWLKVWSIICLPLLAIDGIFGLKIFLWALS